MPPADRLPRPPPGRHHRAAGTHRLAGHAHPASVPGGTGHRLGALGLPPPVSSRQARPTRATHSCGPRARPGALGEPPAPAARVRHTGAGVLRPCDTGTRVPGGDRRPGLAVPQAGLRRTPRALPALVLEARRPRHREPPRAGGAPSRMGWCSLSWRDALPGVAGSPGPGRGLGSVASRALGAQRYASGAANSRSDGGA